MIMKSFEQQFEELQKFYPHAQKALEGGVEFILLPELDLPPNCKPEKSDALLCPVLRDGYHTRLFYSQQISGIPTKNWNGKKHICDRNWVSYSWKSKEGMELLEMVRYHLHTLNYIK